MTLPMPTTISIDGAWLVLRAASAAIALAACSAACAQDVATAPVAAASYRLHPGDLVRLEVYDEPELAATVRITPAGVISFPLIGEITVAGRSAEWMTGEVRRLLEDGYVRKAPVTATVMEFGPRLVYVMGSVGRPDAFPLSPFVESTAMQVIGKAGGFLPDANRNAAQVIRDDPEHPGMKRSFAVPAGDDSESLAKDTVLLPGDIIVVPRLDRVFIMGRVRTVGAVNLPGNEKLTVSKAVSLAGGFDQYARQDQVQLIRNGATVAVVDVRGVLSNQDKGEDPVLMPGDTIFVPEGRF